LPADELVISNIETCDLPPNGLELLVALIVQFFLSQPLRLM
jgi:hypothetical protein